MKHWIRYLALILMLCLVSGSFSSCFVFWRYANTLEELESAADDPSHPDAPDGETPDHMVYRLTEEDRAYFDELLASCEELTMQGTDADAIEAAWETLEDQYYHISTQASIAYVLYCRDQADERLSEDYLTSSAMQTETYDAYMALCRKIDASDSPYREAFFSDWSEAELAQMRTYSEEISVLTQKNQEILVDFRELDAVEDEREIEDLYFSFVKNNNRMAELLGYEDYYAYASETVYLRDYTAAERATMRRYIAEELVPLCLRAFDAFQTAYADLNVFQQTRLESLLWDEYDSFSTDYLALYLESFDGKTEEAMKEVLSPVNSIFEGGKDAYDGAFTVSLTSYERSICYFGPSYQDLSTVVHEMGHYWAAKYISDEELLLDLAEVHSQGNEWLMLAFLEDQINEEVFRTLLYYRIYSALCTVIVSAIVDEFEENVYLQYPSAATGATPDFDGLMETVCARYGGLALLSEVVTDMRVYWKYVTIEAPVYYISYAVSGIAAMSLYGIADADYGDAQAIYRALAEDHDPNKSFEEILSDAGLSSPLDIDTYRTIASWIPE